MVKEKPMEFKNFDLLLTYSETVLGNMKECHDHYCYVGSMNDIERLRELVREGRLAFDLHRMLNPR